jgi:hypothetical protein
MPSTRRWSTWRHAVRIGAATLTVLGLAYSGWKDLPHSWRLMRSQYVSYSGYTRDQRDRAFGTAIPMPMDIIDYWRAWLRPGDRYWIQMPRESFSSFGDKRYVARSISHVYLLPAIETLNLARATVVLSWDADPGLLHLKFSDQERAGLQLIFVSRIAHGA